MKEQKSLVPKYRPILKIFFIVLFCIHVNQWNPPLHSEGSNGIELMENAEAVGIIKQLYSNNREAKEILIYYKPLESRSVIKPAFPSTRDNASEDNETLICKEKSWLFAVDYHPHAQFEHPVDIGIINNCNKDKPEVIKSLWWPKVMGEPVFFSSNNWEKIENLAERSHGDSRRCDYNISSHPGIKPSSSTIIGDPQNNEGFWAIIICGFYEEENSDKSLSYTTDDMYSTLIRYGVNPKKIFYITPNRAGLDNDEYIASDSVSINKISDFFGRVAIQIQPNDKFLFFINTHGGDYKLSLSNNGRSRTILRPSPLNRMLSQIHCRRQFVIISSCGSGSFLSELYPSRDISKPFEGNSNRVVITSCGISEFTYKDIDNRDSRNTCEPNPGDRGSEFVGGFIEAFTDSDADISKDKKISIFEAFLYARQRAFCGDLPYGNCPIIPEYHPRLKYSRGINPANEFLFW